MPVIVMDGTENSYFLVPSEIIDKYLSKASGADMKLLLFLLRNSGRSFETNDISASAGLTADDIAASLDFWIKNRVLEKHNGRYRLKAAGRTSGRPEYDSEVISFKINNDKGLAEIIDKTEKLYAKLLSPAELSILVGLVDWTGFNPDTIYRITEYFFSNGKKGLKYVEKAANEWHEKGIDDDKKVSDQIEKLKNAKKAEFKIAKIIGAENRALTETEKKNITVWLNDFGFDESVIALAYDKTINSTGKYSVSYMNVILNKWNQKGYKTRTDIEKAESSSVKNTRSPRKSELDVDTFVSYSWDIIKNDQDEE